MTKRIVIHRDFGDLVKHEARVTLWLPSLRVLKNELGRSLKYFTLPGPKAYDVIKWKLEDLIRFDGRGYPDVCFCEMNEDYFVNAKRILGNTRGIKAKFEDVIQNPRDKKYSAFWDLFPFDVYNLDFCGTWFEGNEPLSETFSSLVELVNFHVSKKNSGKFLLLVTIRIDRSRTNNDVIDDLRENLESNSQDTRFSTIIDGLTRSDFDKFVVREFKKFILICVPKLIAFKIIPQTTKLSARVERLERAYYRRNSFYIGKFVFLVGKERTSLRINPAWYSNCIGQSLDWANVIEITRKRVQQETKRDLGALKAEIRQLEEYEAIS